MGSGMARGKTEIKVGLTVVLAGIILVAGLLWIKGYSYGRNYHTVDLLFPDVGALETGDPVLVSGVNRGKVKDIVLAADQVKVTINLGLDVILKSDAEFAVKNIGLMGERYIDVRPGHAKDKLETSRPLQGYYDTGIPEVMGVLGRMVEETRDLVHAIRTSFGSDSALTGFVEAVENTRQLTAELHQTIIENRSNLADASRDIAAIADNLRDFTEINREQIERTVDQFDSASASLVSFSGRLDTLSQSLRNLAADVESGEGTLGLLISDDELYNQIKTAAQELDLLLSDIRANPTKYLQVRIRLF